MMAAHDQPVKEFLQIIDDKTMKEVMAYFRLEDYDVFVRYIKTLGIFRQTS
ncbi:MAG: hypothetical protein HMLIMOIP_002012 [Candidatus Nitrosomirales archaeon]|jgi:hypothetical protein